MVGMGGGGKKGRPKNKMEKENGRIRR